MMSRQVRASPIPVKSEGGEYMVPAILGVRVHVGNNGASEFER